MLLGKGVPTELVSFNKYLCYYSGVSLAVYLDLALSGLLTSPQLVHLGDFIIVSFLLSLLRRIAYVVCDTYLLPLKYFLYTCLCSLFANRDVSVCQLWVPVVTIGVLCDQFDEPIQPDETITFQYTVNELVTQQLIRLWTILLSAFLNFLR